MARQDYNLGVVSDTFLWEGSLLIIPELIDGGITAYLRYVRLIGGSLQVRISATIDGDPSDLGPSLVNSLTDSNNDDSAIILTSESRTIEVRNPGHSSNSFSDPTEPYFWTPSNSSELSTFYVDSVGSDLTLTLYDGIDVIYQEVEVNIEAPIPEANITLVSYPTLRVSDLDIENYTVEFSSLIRVGDTEILFLSPDQGGSDILLQGDLLIDNDNTRLSRVRWSNSLLILNDRNLPNSTELGAYFGPGGSGNDLILVFQKEIDGSDRIEIPVETYFPSAGSFGNNYIRFGEGTALTSGIIDFFDGLSVDDRIIFAGVRLTQIYQELEVNIEAPVPETNITLESFAYHNIAVIVETPAAQATITLESVVIVVNDIQVNIETPIPEVDISLESFTVHGLQVNIETPVPEVRANLVFFVPTIHSLQVNIETPVPEIRARLRSVAYNYGALTVEIETPIPEVELELDLITITREEISIDSVSIVGSTVVIRLSESVLSGNKVLLNYIIPNNNPVQNLGAYTATSITDLEVVNNT